MNVYVARQDAVKPRAVSEAPEKQGGGAGGRRQLVRSRSPVDGPAGRATSFARLATEPDSRAGPSGQTPGVAVTAILPSLTDNT